MVKISRCLGRRSKLLLRIAAGGMVLLLGAFVVSNMVLAGLVEKNLRRRTQMRWTVARATWSPWGGIQMSGIRAEIENQKGVTVAPVLQVARVRLDPYWTSLVQKKPKFREILVETPKGNVPIEFLSLLVASGGGGAVPQVVGVSGLAADSDPVLPQDKKKGAQPGKSTKKKADAKPKKQPAKSSEKKAGEQKSAGKRKVEPDLPCRVRVRGGDLRIYSLGAGGQDLQVTGIDLDLPISGPEAEGSVKMAGARVGKSLKFGPFVQRLHWKQPFLVCPEKVVEWQGLKVRFGGRLQTRGRPLYSVALQAMPGSITELELPDWTGLRVGVEEVKVVLLRSEGDLRRPGTWQAEMVLDVRGVQFVQKQWEVGHYFDVGQVVAVFRQGVLNVADARLRSEELSLMGNGVVAANGRVWSVLRLVASPEYTYVINRAAVGSGISRGWMRSWLQPMVTPDRWYRDVHMEGTVGQLMADVGRKRGALEIRTVLARVRSFLRGEIQEEELLAPDTGEEGGSS